MATIKVNQRYIELDEPVYIINNQVLTSDEFDANPDLLNKDYKIIYTRLDIHQITHNP